MNSIKLAIASTIVLASGCVARNFSEGNSKKSSNAAIETVSVKIESTSVTQLARVIGIEQNEAACVGGNPKFSFEVSAGAERTFEIPVSVKKIGLCGQARPDGMDYKHIDVSLEKGVRYVIRDDKLIKLETPVQAGFARIRIQSTSVQKLVRVIGIEKAEAACVGGSPKFTFDVKADQERVYDFPVSVKKIGLCGQARADGMDYKHLDVVLKDGASYVVDGDVVKELAR